MNSSDLPPIAALPEGPSTASGDQQTEVQRGLSDAQLSGVYRRYGAMVKRCADRVFRDGSTGDDVLNDVMVRVWKNGESLLQLDSEKQKRAWLIQTTLRRCWDVKARRKREVARIGELEKVHPQSFSAGAEARVGLDEVLDRLDVEERILAVLFFEEGRSKAEIAEMTGRSRPYIDKKLAHIQRVQDASRSSKAGERS